MKLKLKHPLTFGAKTVEELNFRDWTTAADYLSFDVKGGVAQNIALVASLTGTDEALVKQLRGADYRAATKIADALLASDIEAGGEGDAEKKPSAS
jgi:hypothetical protein